MSTPFSLAPDQLWQAINPITAYQQGAQFGFINIDLGAAGESDLERKLLDRVGSYGRQLGRIGDALEVILKHVKLGRSETRRAGRAGHSQGPACIGAAGEGGAARERAG